ncbi:MAG: FHA domain-containing protein [Anaerolineaceae bacterium]|nr:FHA domain-containing protein [Anaerolineaceae bacterium]
MSQSSDDNFADERGKPAHAHHFYLDIVAQNGKRQRVPLPQTELVIGRSPNRCELVIDDNRISRVHLRVSRDPDKGITVTDLYSANGTVFDGRKLEPGVPITWLINQTAHIGDSRLTLRYGTMETKRLGDG